MMHRVPAHWRRQLLRGTVLLITLMAAVESAHADARLLIVSGIGGDENYSQQFRDWALQMRAAAVERVGLAAQDVIWLCEAPQRDSIDCAGESRREAILQVIAQLLDDAPAYRPLMVLLIGHGTARDGRALFNVAGPDLSARDLHDVLARDPSLLPLPLPSLSPPLSPSPLAVTSAPIKRWVAVVNSTPASAPFAALLAARARIIITATASGAEDDHTRFAAHFIAAYASGSADADRDGRVSLLEAFRFASAEVEREYAAKRQLRTEHALLEDNADGQGSLTPAVLVSADHGRSNGNGNGDGDGAAAFFLAAAIRGGEASPARAALESEARDLVARVHELRRRKVAMAAQDYEQELESLLVKLAINRRTKREDGS